VTSSNAGSLCPGVALCTTDTAVAELHLVKQVDRTTAAPGENVTYTVTASNAGQLALPGATFTDNLAAVLDDATIGTVSATLGTATLSPPTLTWTGDLPIGASAQITYTASITGAGDRVLTNEVISTSLGTTCPVPTDAGCAVTLTVGPGSTPPPSPSPPVPTGAPGTTPVGPAVPAGPGPVTGLPLAVLVESAVILLVLGSLVLWWARRRRMAGEL